MKKIYFISDAHLGIDSQIKETYKENQLFSFFEYIRKDADCLIIVGDLFDFWFDYRWTIPRHYLNTVAALKHLRENGIQIMYCIGNHDFWLGDFFKEDLKISVHQDPIEIEADGQKFYITHGDGLNKRDIGYRFLKTILRSPVTKAVCRLMHPDLTFTIARWSSLLSRQHRPDHDHREPYIDQARKLFKDNYDFVVFGHTHDPMILEENGHTYINTGEWFEQFTYAVYDHRKLKLRKWQSTNHRGNKA